MHVALAVIVLLMLFVPFVLVGVLFVWGAASPDYWVPPQAPQNRHAPLSLERPVLSTVQFGGPRQIHRSPAGTLGSLSMAPHANLRKRPTLRRRLPAGRGRQRTRICDPGARSRRQRAHL